MSFQNLYYKRTAGTAKACYVCYRPTTTVLATINTTDFLYTCPGHLTDPNFASQVKDGNAKKQISPEEIAKVKEEWEEKQRRKKEKEKEKDAAKAEKGDDKKEGEKEGGNDKPKEKKDGGVTSPIRTPSTSVTPTDVHERYILHRDYFASGSIYLPNLIPSDTELAVRQTEHRKRRQAIQARELAPRLPGAPSGLIVKKDEE